MLALAYAVLFLPLVVSAVRTAVANAPPVLEDVSPSLGKGQAATRILVTIPLVTPGVPVVVITLVIGVVASRIAEWVRCGWRRSHAYTALKT